MKETIEDNKFVELNYQIVDQKTGSVLTEVEFPIGYVHGVNDILSSDTNQALAGHSVGDVIELPIDTDKVFGKRDETLVFTDHIDNVPAEYQEIGMVITMENKKGNSKQFIVTKIDDKALTIDGNHPLCERDVMFVLKVLSIRDATEEEIESGGVISDKNQHDHWQNSVSINSLAIN